MQATIQHTDAALIAAGFQPITYPDRSGTYYRRDTKVESMPYLSTVTDDQFIFASCVATTEVRPDGKVTLAIVETGYLEEPEDIGSEDGQAVLRDAIEGIVAVNAMPTPAPRSS